jgi:AAA+ ATPase superfamily predicted ATPase
LINPTGAIEMSKFIGRHAELKKLTDLQRKKTASFVVIRGRRRIGKSRLVEELGKSFDKFYSFIGLPPEEGVTSKDQLEEFSRQIAQQFNTAAAQYDDWSNALWAVGERVKKGKILVLFDEISWMGSKDTAFLGKIKNFWDQHLKKNDQLIFIVCGSASAWIEKNILSSTGFVGRISYTLTLKELPLSDCNKFWPKGISAYEKLKVLSVTGGIPKYLEEVDPKMSAEANIKKMCFTKGGFLSEEFIRIFSDLFLRESDLYKKIIQTLSGGAKEGAEICELLRMDQNGRMSEYLSELDLAGFLSRDHTWNVSTGVDSKLSKYRLSDNYLRFYLKYIEKNQSKIMRDSFNLKSLTALPEWSTIMGLQFENLVLNNRNLIHQVLEMNPEDIVSENPFYQHKTIRNPGCQIDYMIQTKFGSLYICEIKFLKKKVDLSIISQMEKKVEAIKFSKGFSCRPVLIHVNGVDEEVVDSDYFSEIIDFSKFLE